LILSHKAAKTSLILNHEILKTPLILNHETLKTPLILSHKNGIVLFKSFIIEVNENETISMGRIKKMGKRTAQETLVDPRGASGGKNVHYQAIGKGFSKLCRD